MIPAWYSLDVSRETLECLTAYKDLILKWNRTINLISRTDEKQILERHIWDSAQVYLHITQDASSWLDVGSGAGLPGIVVAILTQDQKAKLKVTLIESDKRKCAFLQSACLALNLDVTVISKRVEDSPTTDADIISARAFAPVVRILDMTESLRTDKTTYLLPKGRSWKSEIEEAKKRWQFDMSAMTSNTDEQSAILKLTNVQHH